MTKDTPSNVVKVDFSRKAEVVVPTKVIYRKKAPVYQYSKKALNANEIMAFLVMHPAVQSLTYSYHKRMDKWVLIAEYVSGNKDCSISAQDPSFEIAAQELYESFLTVLSWEDNPQ